MYNPAKVKDVDKILAKYEGREDVVIQVVRDKYEL